ncbi:MAG: YibE/F family protein [Bacillota bacterium]
MKWRRKLQSREALFALVILLITVAIAFLPTPARYRRAAGVWEARCVVLQVDNSAVFQKGIFKMGEQQVTVKILDGPDRGKTLAAMNLLQGAIELEWFYQTGERAIVGYSKTGATVVGARMLEPLRENAIWTIFIIFFLVLLAFSGWTGIKAMLSFAFAMVVIWKILLPLNLQNTIDPILLAVLVVAALCFVIIFLVAGFNRKGWSAFWGAFGGCVLTWMLPLLLGRWLKINGATSQYSTALRFSGYESLNLLELFYAAIILSASGAIMDIAMDIAAAMTEIKEKKPEIGRKELIRSGLTIGRAVIGTMSTTLLLAYSGSALTMLMYLLSKGLSVWRILNMNYLASEILKTVSGSLGLILAAPLTALVSGLILTRTHTAGEKEK